MAGRFIHKRRHRISPFGGDAQRERRGRKGKRAQIHAMKCSADERSPRSLLPCFHCARFTFTQSYLPDLYGECFRLNTMPSSPRWRHSASSCSPFLNSSEWRT